VADQKLYQAPADWLAKAVDALLAAGVKVIAPTETEPGVVNLAAVESGEAAVGEFDNVERPLKGLFLPITEVLLSYERNDDGDIDVRPEPMPASDDVVVMGYRPCDASALDAIDRVFQWDYDDVRYRARRERATLVGFACSAAAAECFCTSVGGSPHDSGQSDVLVFRGDGDGALLEVFTDKGETFIERLGDLVRPAPEGTSPPAPPEVPGRFHVEKVKQWLDENFENDFWREDSLRCLGCGACTFLCPSCHCFDIVDEGRWNGGRRRRNWDCCSHAQFTLHASGHNPRPVQEARHRQRVMHKFKYFPERFGRTACVGCGRCIRVCGVGQNLLATLAAIEAQ